MPRWQLLLLLCIAVVAVACLDCQLWHQLLLLFLLQFDGLRLDGQLGYALRVLGVVGHDHRVLQLLLLLLLLLLTGVCFDG